MAIKRRTSANTLFTLLLFLTFALCAFFVLALSVRAYRASEAEIHINDEARTGLAYLVSKVRHYDAINAVETGEFDGLNALFLYETHEGERYTTVLYAADGGLYELFAADVSQFDRSSGARVVAGASARFFLRGETLTIEYEAGGEAQSVSLALRGGGGTL
ncbi:MAG: DUF4860 domain-containing protein [Clostridiaceae bacterium]|nr:DUF4860 domain-containing protein [Eubacteriales bacterium]